MNEFGDRYNLSFYDYPDYNNKRALRMVLNKREYIMPSLKSKDYTEETTAPTPTPVLESEETVVASSSS